MPAIIRSALIASYVMSWSGAMAQPILTERDASAKLQTLGSYPDCGAIIPFGMYSFAAIGETPAELVLEKKTRFSRTWG